MKIKLWGIKDRRGKLVTWKAKDVPVLYRKKKTAELFCQLVAEDHRLIPVGQIPVQVILHVK